MPASSFFDSQTVRAPGRRSFFDGYMPHVPAMHVADSSSFAGYPVRHGASDFGGVHPAISGGFFDQATMPRRRAGQQAGYPYAQTPFASMHNSGANDYFNRTGVMPRTTYGGNFGQALPNPANVPTDAQHMAAMMGSQYAPMHQAPLAMAPGNNLGYLNQMGAQNPGGRFFQGALPAYGTSSGGNVRPMFTGIPQAPQGVALNQMQAWGEAHGYPTHPVTGGLLPASSSQNPNMKAAAAMFDARRGGLGQRQQDYQARNYFDMAGRQAGVLNNAQNRADARRVRMGIGNPINMAMRANPQIAGMMGMQGMQNANSQNWMQHQAGMFQQKQMADMHNGYMDRMTQLAGAIPGMNLPPGLQQQYMNHIMGQFGMPMASSDAFARPPHEAPSSKDLAKLSPAERKQAMQQYSQATRDRIEQEITAQHQPGFWQRFFGMDPMAADWNTDGIDWLYNYNPFTRLGGALVPQSPPPVGLSPRARAKVPSAKASK